MYVYNYIYVMISFDLVLCKKLYSDINLLICVILECISIVLFHVCMCVFSWSILCPMEQTG